MKLAINATYNPSGGSKTQLVNMLRYFLRVNDIKIIIYINRNNLGLVQDIDQSNVKVVISRFAGISKVIRVIWEQTLLPFLLIKEKVGVLFCPGNIAPIFSSVKTIQWIGTIGPFINDIYKFYPLYNKIEFFVNKHIMRLSALKSDMVIHESEFSRNLFIRKYGAEKRKTEVIYHGKDSYYYPKNIVDEKIIFSNKIRFTDPFVLCVSHIYPYKNITRMIKAFDIARKTTGSDLHLIIAGNIVSDKYYNSLLFTIDKLELTKLIIFLGQVSKKELIDLYSSCLFFVFPSPFESIGITLFEAMACGAAITCSNTTAIPEACQDAALYFNPYDIEEMAEKISLLISDEKLRKSLSQKSIARANELPDYEEVTIKTLDIIKNFMNLRLIWINISLTLFFDQTYKIADLYFFKK